MVMCGTLCDLLGQGLEVGQLRFVGLVDALLVEFQQPQVVGVGTVARPLGSR